MFNWLGRLPYVNAWELQENTRNTMLQDPSLPGQYFLTEHPPTLTYGRGETGTSFLQAKSWYLQNGFAVIETNRGGKLTYHGPGQLVAYPVVNLSKLKWGVKQYVWQLEEVMLAICAAHGVQATRNSGFPGAWVGNKKIGSIGLHIRKQVSIHGFALNIDPNLEHFSWISPCGLEGVSMTSLAHETCSSIDLNDSVRIAQETFLKFDQWKHE